MADLPSFSALPQPSQEMAEHRSCSAFRHPTSQLKTTCWSGFQHWGRGYRIILVLVFAVLCAAASSYLRFRVYAFTLHMYPNYSSSEWSPFVQAFKELAWFGYALSLVLAGVAVNRWLAAADMSSTSYVAPRKVSYDD